MPAAQELEQSQQPRLWKANGWTACILKNEDDDGWAVAMTPDGESEPALVGPWTMGRDKKNPKPLDNNAFLTLVKTAKEFLARTEQHQHASLNQSFTIPTEQGNLTVSLSITPDEDNPYAMLRAHDAFSQELAALRVAPNFKLSRGSAAAWVEANFAEP